MTPQQPVPDSGDIHVVQSRIERGAAAMGTDGQIGAVEQIVVDRESGQLLSLVIRGDESGTEFELPANHVRRATGDHVYLDISRADLAGHPEMATPYHPEQYVPVYHGDIMSTGTASRYAAARERPMITDVEENAAAIVAPEMLPTPPTDERAAPPSPAPSAEPGASTARPPEREAGGQEQGRGPTDWGEAVGTEARPVPTPEPSATPSTTGPLMGGKPSTGGMGAASSVPTSPAPALDTVPTSPDLPPYTTEHTPESQPPEPNQAPASGGETAESAPPRDAAPLSASAKAVDVTPGAELPSLAAISPVSPPRQQQGAPGPKQSQCASSQVFVPGVLRNIAKSPEPWIMAASLGAGALGGILLRQRRISHGGGSAAEWIRRGMEGTLGEAQDRLLEAPGRFAERASETMRGARSDTRELAQRMALRGRWFRRGLLLGGASALLFTPKTGTETRARLRDVLEQWWSPPAPD